MIQVYVIYDTKAEAYGQPMFLEAEGLAKRSFMSACVNAESPISAEPQSYSLYNIGKYDPQNGIIKGKTPELIMTALDAIKQSRLMAEELKYQLSEEENK